MTWKLELPVGKEHFGSFYMDGEVLRTWAVFSLGNAHYIHEYVSQLLSVVFSQLFRKGSDFASFSLAL